MYSFSMEEACQNIYKERTKEQFQEVISSYQSQNYRSAIVMLWSVVVCDLVYKLQELQSVYQDSGAESILKYIEDEQRNHPTSSQWELTIFEKSQKNTGIISMFFLEEIRLLQKLRHNCAHPVMGENYELFNPPGVKVRSYIQTALEGLLTKSPIMHKKSFSTFLGEANELYPRMSMMEEAFCRYLTNKYFKRLNWSGITYYFITLWKFAFKLENEDCDNNRQLHILLIKFLLRMYKNDFIMKFTFQSNYDEISKKEKIIKSLIALLSEFPDLFYKLSENSRILIEDVLENNRGEYLISSTFMSRNLSEHVGNFADGYYTRSGRISYQYLDRFKEICNQEVEGDNKNVVAMCFLLVEKINDFEAARDIMNDVVVGCIECFSDEDIKKLLELVDGNNQIYGYANASKYCVAIKNECEKRGIEYGDYDNFSRNV